MALWLAAEPLLLASRSKIRRVLLMTAGIPVKVEPADLDERGIEAAAPLQTPGALAALLARTKADAVAGRYRDRLVLGADQTLALGAQHFSKPADRNDAREQLRALSGKTHDLHSAITFVQDGATVFEDVGIAHMTMRPLSERFIDSYLEAAGNAATTSVGAYQIEGLGIHLFDRIDGDYFTVLGLPLMPALEFLRQHGSLAR